MPTIAQLPPAATVSDSDVLPISQAGITRNATLALLQAATKSYVDAQVLTALPTAGGTLAGALTLALDPTGPLQAATKQYADGKLARTGDTLLGPLSLASGPTTANQAATKSYVDAQV